MAANNFISSISPLAKRLGSTVLPSVIIAQACLESSYGRSELAINACNIFGMKVNLSTGVWDGASYEVQTKEHKDGTWIAVPAQFRKYANWAMSISDHNDYLLSSYRYTGLSEVRTPEAQLKIIKAGGYATDPEYVTKVMAVIDKYDLTQYDKEEIKMAKVFLGVGHGGSDPGAIKYVVEKDANLTMALAARDVLAAHGVTVKMSRTVDEDDPIEEEIKEANAYGPAIAVDVHNNSGGGDGFEAFYQTNSYKNKSYKLAQCIETAVKATGQSSRGLKTKLNSAGTADYFGFLRRITCPAIIVEGFFVDNMSDASGYDTVAEQKAMGVAYAKGILAYLGITYKASTSTVSVASTLTKEDVEMERYNKLSDIPNDYGARDVIEVLMNLNIIKGDGSDKTGNNDVIDLSKDQVRNLIWQYRGGAFDRALIKAGKTPIIVL